MTAEDRSRATTLPDTGDGLPTLDIGGDGDPALRVLRTLQKVLLQHPVAAQTAFNALVAEGRRFAETPEGREWHSRLVGSSLVQRARLVFDLSTLSMLEDEPPELLPSSYVDVIFMLASSPSGDEILNRLFRWENDSVQR